MGNEILNPFLYVLIVLVVALPILWVCYTLEKRLQAKSKPPKKDTDANAPKGTTEAERRELRNTKGWNREYRFFQDPPLDQPLSKLFSEGYTIPIICFGCGRRFNVSKAVLEKVHDKINCRCDYTLTGVSKKIMSTDSCDKEYIMV